MSQVEVFEKKQPKPIKSQLRQESVFSQKKLSQTITGEAVSNPVNSSV